MRYLLGFILVSMFLAAFPLRAAEPTGLQIDHAWARATPPGAESAAVYLRITNPTAHPGDTLLGASTEVAKTAGLHTHQEEKGVMRMRSMAAIPIPSGQVVEAHPGGLHIMLTELVRPLAAGQEFTLTLRFEHAGNISVPVKVEPLDFEPDNGQHHHH